MKLQDFAEHQKGFAFKSKDYIEDGVAVVRVSNLTTNSIDTSDLKYVSDEVAADKSNFKLIQNDVVIATVGSWPKNPASVVGKVIKVPESCDNYLLNQNAVRFRVKSQESSDQLYLYYLLKSKKFSDYIISTAQGSANQASITLKDIYAFEFDCPTSSERKRIAEILSAMDDKSDVNRKTNQTLEQMAQALFKSWFVDFDPVFDNALASGVAVSDFPEALQKKAQLRFEQRQQVQQQIGNGELEAKPLPKDIRQLFPNQFEQTDEPSIGINGWVPKGWNVKTLGESCSLVSGKSYKSAELEPSENALVTLKSFQRGGGYRLDGLKEYTGNFKDTQVVSTGDIILSCTDVTQAAELVGRPALVATDRRYNKLIISLDVMRVIPNDDQQKMFFYYLLAHNNFTQFALSHCTGTTVLHLKKKAIPDYTFLKPKEALIDLFSAKVINFISKCDLNIQENRSLAKLRDTLLPKLISGELQLSTESRDAEVSA